MEPAAKKLKFSEEKCLDPFENALIEDIRDLMFQHLTGEEVKQIYEVSPLWNEIASSSKTCGDKLEIRIIGYNVPEKLFVIPKNKRKYGTLFIHPDFLEDTHSTTLLQEIVAGIGSALKELTFTGWIKTSNVVLLLNQVHELESLHISQMIDGDSVVSSPLLLPKLRKLHLHFTKNLWLDLFSNVSGLEEFHFVSIESSINNDAFENFILRQDKLKKLAILSQQLWSEHPLFSDLSRVKFRLEKIFISGFQLDNNAIGFFKQQESLKEVGLESLIVSSPAAYREILRSIWMLPKLNNFSYGEGLTDEDFAALSNIRNESVTLLSSRENNHASIDGRIFEIFPNLKCHKIDAKTLYLTNVPSDKLAILTNQTVCLCYQPPLADFDQEKFESDVIKLIRRTNKIEFLDIGRREWIEQGINLSIDFWKNVIEILSKLKQIVIYNFDDVKKLVQLLIDCQRNFQEVVILTNTVGQASIEGMELPSWLLIIDME